MRVTTIFWDACGCRDKVVLQSNCANFKAFSDLKRKRLKDYKEKRHKDLKDIFKVNGFKQLIHEPTRITKESSTFIDIIASTHQHNIAKAIVFPNDISDHDLIGVVRKLKNTKYRGLLPGNLLRNYKSYNKEIFKNDLKTVQWDSLLRINDLNDAWNKFKELLIACVNKHAPVIEQTISGRECPWLTSEIKGKIKERDYYLKKARKSKSEIDWSTYRRMRNSVTMMIRKNKANYHRSLFKESAKSRNTSGRKLRNYSQQRQKTCNPLH